MLVLVLVLVLMLVLQLLVLVLVLVRHALEEGGAVERVVKALPRLRKAGGGRAISNPT